MASEVSISQGQSHAYRGLGQNPAPSEATTEGWIGRAWSGGGKGSCLKGFPEISEPDRRAIAAQGSTLGRPFPSLELPCLSSWSPHSSILTGLGTSASYFHFPP